jgi:hypothetical protein
LVDLLPIEKLFELRKQHEGYCSLTSNWSPGRQGGYEIAGKSAVGILQILLAITDHALFLLVVLVTGKT